MVRQMEYVALLQMKTPENKEYEIEAHIHLYSIISRLPFSHDDTPHEKCSSFTDGVGTLCEQMPRQSPESQTLTSSLRSDKSPAQVNYTEQEIFTSHKPSQVFIHRLLKVCKCYFSPFFCSQRYCQSTAFLWPSLSLGVLSAGYIHLADNFCGDRRACIPLQAQSTEISVDKSLVSCMCKLPLLQQSQLQGTAARCVHHSLQLHVAQWLQLDWVEKCCS